MAPDGGCLPADLRAADEATTGEPARAPRLRRPAVADTGAPGTIREVGGGVLGGNRRVDAPAAGTLAQSRSREPRVLPCGLLPAPDLGRALPAPGLPYSYGLGLILGLN
jgi:hypothetical protein